MAQRKVAVFAWTVWLSCPQKQQRKQQQPQKEEYLQIEKLIWEKGRAMWERKAERWSAFDSALLRERKEN